MKRQAAQREAVPLKPCVATLGLTAWPAMLALALPLALLWAAGCSGVEADVLSLRQPRDLGVVVDGQLPRPGTDLGWSIPPFPPMNPLRCAERTQGNVGGLTCQTVETWLLSAAFDCRQWSGGATGAAIDGGSAAGGHVEGPMLLTPCGGLGTTMPPMAWTGVRYWCCPGLPPTGSGGTRPTGAGGAGAPNAPGEPPAPGAAGS